jgi:DNA-binding XRE family transcriptional regulator
MKLVNNLPKLIKAKQDEYKAENNAELTELYIAVGIGINPTTLSHYKNGKIESVNWEIWQKLVKYFGVPGHEIFDVLLDEADDV